MLVYRVHDTTGDDLGTIPHAATNVEPGDIVFLTDGREVAIAPTPLTSDDGIA